MDKRIMLLSLASFAIGTEGFMIAGILPALARDFNVSLSAAGQLVTIFSLVYAIGSPVLATLTRRWDRKRVLIAAILVSAAAALLIRRLFPAIPSPGSATLRERLSCLRNPVLLSALLTTLAWGIGIFALYTYVADIFAGFGATSRMLSLVLFLDGIACLIGVNLGGYSADRFGSSRTIALSLSLLTVSMALLSILGGVTGLSGAFAVALGTLALALWGASGYAFNPAQQHRLIRLSGPASGIVLSPCVRHSSGQRLGSVDGRMGRPIRLRERTRLFRRRVDASGSGRFRH